MSDEPVQDQKIKVEESPIEEYPLGQLDEILANSKERYYSVDALRDPRTKRKLVDPRSILTDTIVRNLYESWSLSKDTIIRVTKRLESIDDLDDDSLKTISYYASRIHRYLVRIYTDDKPSYKAEIQGITSMVVEMVDGIFGPEKIDEVTVGPSDLRSHNFYYDHLVNAAIYWLATMAILNKQRKNSPAGIEAWRFKNKAEVSRLTQGRPTQAKSLVVYYDYYGRDRAPADVEPAKKGDLSLVLSGFYGALFHDICFRNEPKIIISRKGHIDDKLKQHMDLSNQLLKEKLSILADERPLTRNIIKNHHEYIDGSGYPNGKKEKELHLFSQLLSVVDLYDEYSTRFNRSTIIRFMARGAGRIFSGELVRAFLSILRPFDFGEIVQVYEGKKTEPVMRAEVLQSANRFRPVIKVLEADAPEHEQLVGNKLDLSNDENVIFSI